MLHELECGINKVRSGISEKGSERYVEESFKILDELVASRPLFLGYVIAWASASSMG